MYNISNALNVCGFPLLVKSEIIGLLLYTGSKPILSILFNREPFCQNWCEKGSREDDLESNQHSNGEHFSQSVRFFFFYKMDANIMTTFAIIIKIDVIIVIEKIIYTTDQ